MDDSYKLKKLLKELEGKRGRHTELISLYIPKDYPMIEIMNLLANEISLTQNVKSKAVRNNVIDALTKINQQLRLYKKLPANGLAIFCGNVSEQEGKTDIKIWVVEPPEAIKVKLYWCDQTFELGHLRDMVKEKEVYGLLIMDTKEATFGMLRGKSVKPLRRIDSIVPSKVGKGGQSQQRFERVREGLINDFYKKIAEVAKGFFSEDMKGIIIGGPGPSKYNFFDGGYLETQLKNRVLGIKDVGYTDEPGLNELVEKSADLLAESAVSKERDIVNKFFAELQKDSGMVTYGLRPVLKALEAGAVKTILVTEDLEYSELEYQCSCGQSGKIFSRNDEIDQAVCPKCGQKIIPIGKIDIVEAFEDLAKLYGTDVEIISHSTREGEQLYQLGGIGAILRYKL